MMGEDVYGVGAVMRHMVTGVPPHLTVEKYRERLQQR